MIFYDKNKLPPPPDIQVTIDETPLQQESKKTKSLELLLVNNS